MNCTVWQWQTIYIIEQDNTFSITQFYRRETIVFIRVISSYYGRFYSLVNLWYTLKENKKTVHMKNFPLNKQRGGSLKDFVPYRIVGHWDYLCFWNEVLCFKFLFTSKAFSVMVFSWNKNARILIFHGYNNNTKHYKVVSKCQTCEIFECFFFLQNFNMWCLRNEFTRKGCHSALGYLLAIWRIFGN